jgi:hypothetical protein
MILEPVPALAWTKGLEGYERARLSAEEAMLRIWSRTEGAHAVTKSALAGGDPWLDRCLYEVRVGSIQPGSPEILRRLEHAQKIGKAEWFIDRLAAELKNVKKRVQGALPFSDIRAILATDWVRTGFWLMSDDLIARAMTTRKYTPTGCNRQTITKAVKDLRLIKHSDTSHRPIVKAFGKDGKFIFRTGYPPKPQAVA